MEVGFFIIGKYFTTKKISSTHLHNRDSRVVTNWRNWIILLKSLSPEIMWTQWHFTATLSRNWELKNSDACFEYCAKFESQNLRKWKRGNNWQTKWIRTRRAIRRKRRTITRVRRTSLCRTRRKTKSRKRTEKRCSSKNMRWKKNKKEKKKKKKKDN